MRYIICFLLIMFLVLACPASSHAKEPNNSSTYLLDELPEFILYNSKNEKINSSIFAGSTAVFTFIVEECEACYTFLNELQKAFYQFEEQYSLIVITPLLADTLIAKTKASSPEAIILADPIYKVADIFDVQEAPSSYLFNNGQFYGNIPWNAKGEQIAIHVMIARELDPLAKEKNLVKPGDIFKGIKASDSLGDLVVIEYFEKPTLLMFSSNNCYSCVVQIEQLAEINYEKQGFDILIINGEKAWENQAEYGTPDLNVLFDEDGSVFANFGIWATPTYALVYKDKIIDVWVGEISKEIIEDTMHSWQN